MFLEIISPQQTIFSGEVSEVFLPGKEGHFELLNDHAPLISLLQNGQIKITKTDGTKETFQTEQGFVEVLDNKITVLV
jgi:F-type H+-transporting ATPase subunit epsilon